MHPTLLHSNDKDNDVHREDKQSQMAETLLLVDTNKGRRAAKEGGNGLIGHLLSRPTLTYHPFAPVIRRPTNNTSMETDPSPLPNPLLSPLSPFLLSSTRAHREREREERSMRKAHSFPFRVPLPRSTSFDEAREDRDECVVEFSTGDYRNRFSRMVSRCNRFVLSSRDLVT